MQRKEFIRKAAFGAAAFTIVPRYVLGGPGYQVPSDRIHLGYIGTGKQAPGLLNNLNACPETLVLAACDVNSARLQQFVGRATEANNKKVAAAVAAYRHYRELLSRTDIDAVVIVTPDHWHAQMVVEAAKRGKDMYCEKPLSLTVAEGRAMADAVRKHGRVLQTGSMQRSQHNFRHAAELVLNGYIGHIREINVAIGDPVRQCDAPTEPTPPEFDWDLWIGPSLYRGYTPQLAPPFGNNEWARWREFRGFGGGYLSDWGAHMFDIVQWALDMDRSGPVLFEPPARPGSVRGLSFTYANGVKVHHKNWGEHNAIQFVGEEGTIEVSRSFLRATPESVLKTEFRRTDKRLYRSENHYQDWIDAIKKRSRPVADVETGHRTATIANLGNIAYELCRPFRWNPRRELTSDVSANLMLTRPYRGEWVTGDW